MPKTQTRTKKRQQIKKLKKGAGFFDLLKSKKNCYRLRNPYYDVLINKMKKGEKVSNNQKKELCVK